MRRSSQNNAKLKIGGWARILSMVMMMMMGILDVHSLPLSHQSKNAKKRQRLALWDQTIQFTHWRKWNTAFSWDHQKLQILHIYHYCRAVANFSGGFTKGCTWSRCVSADQIVFFQNAKCICPNCNMYLLWLISVGGCTNRCTWSRGVSADQQTKMHFIY